MTELQSHEKEHVEYQVKFELKTPTIHLKITLSNFKLLLGITLWLKLFQ